MNVRQKTGGRIAGTPNRITAQVRSMLTVVLEQEIENLPELLTKVSPQARLTAVLKLTELICPPLARWDEYSSLGEWKDFIRFTPEMDEPQETLHR